MTARATTTDTLMIASPLDVLQRLCGALSAEAQPVPSCPVGEDAVGFEAAWSDVESLQQWRDVASSGPKVAAVVVAVWPEAHVAAPLMSMSPAEFARRAEWPFLAWYAALGAAISRCADGGTIVALVERPSPLDAAGWAPECGQADAVEALVRSLARSEGPRGVRINAVTTPARVAPSQPIAPAPPLSTYPGRIDVEVTDAVAMLLGAGVGGVTGTVVHVDCGRSWR
ncbi:MAG: hypothetical protein JWN62_1639 [Acidimicrobiales bacterium]|nr:hypothetical protein [Acidimicrobiales bacterium]